MNPWDIPDHPVIRNMELTGYPDGKEPDYPHCPVCGEECFEIFQTKDGDIIGCSECLQIITADEDALCPECEEPAETLYKNQDGEIIGCDNCISPRDAWETEACFPDKDRW